jgi:hypothetical protein
MEHDLVVRERAAELVDDFALDCLPLLGPTGLVARIVRRA